MKTLSRRTFLRGAAGGAALSLGLPLLDAMVGTRATRRARGDDLGLGPVFGVFFWGGGTPWHGLHHPDYAALPDTWTPTGTGAGYTASELIDELSAHAPSVATGLTPTTAIPDSPGGQSDGHMRGFMVCMTGDRPRSEGFDHPTHTLTALRPTLDQVVARDPRFYAALPARYRSLVLGVSTARFHDYGHWQAISYNGPDSLNQAVTDPAQLWDMLFAAPPDTAEVTARADLLDAVMDDARSLDQRLGAADRQRLASHLDNLSDIQRRLRLAPATCEPIERPGGGGLGAGDLVARTELMARLLATAVQCNLTRAFSFMLTSPATTHVFNQFGETRDFHSVVHNGPWDTVRTVHHHQMQAFARFLDVFAGTMDADGQTLMDRSCILGLSEYAEGNRHSVNELPALLVGGACGRLKRGVHVRDVGGSFSRVQLTALRALGLETESFGWNGGETSSPLSEILA
ncbi:MAG TPA: DUF1552 domain-containing protein [Kofleriaceae bacterium]|nr:DUF1552 domain-containing protein [Kofleriaceae bacterium]